MCPVSTAWDMSEEVAASSTCFLRPMMPMVLIVKERRLQTNVLLVYMIRVSHSEAFSSNVTISHIDQSVHSLTCVLPFAIIGFSNAHQH